MEKEEKVTKIKADIKECDKKINNSRAMINILNGMKDSVASLNKNIDNCIDLLNSAIKGGNTSAVLSNISYDSNRSATNMIEGITDDRETYYRTVKDETMHKDELTSEYKKEVNGE